MSRGKERKDPRREETRGEAMQGEEGGEVLLGEGKGEARDRRSDNQIRAQGHTGEGRRVAASETFTTKQV